MWLYPRHRWVLYPLLAPNSPKGEGEEEEKGREKEKREGGREKEKEEEKGSRRGVREEGSRGEVYSHVCHEAMMVQP